MVVWFLVLFEDGFAGKIYTYYAASNGITRTFGEAGKGRINLVAEGAINPPASDRTDAYVKGFEAKYPDHDISQARIANVVEMLAKAIEEAGTSTDVVKVAYALEGMEHDSIWGGKVFMRPQDHQAIQDVHIQEHTDEGITNPLDNSEFGLRKVSTVEMAAMDSPTTCKMKRP